MLEPPLNYQKVVSFSEDSYFGIQKTFPSPKQKFAHVRTRGDDEI